MDPPSRATGGEPTWNWPENTGLSDSTNAAVATGSDATGAEARLRSTGKTAAGTAADVPPDASPNDVDSTEATEGSESSGDGPHQLPAERQRYQAGGRGDGDGDGGGLHGQNEHEEHRQFRRRYKPRTCRICLETVQPTFDMGEADDDHDDHGEPEGALAAGLIPEDELGGVLNAVRERVVAAVASALPRMPAMPAFFQRAAEPRVRYVPEDPRDGRLLSPCRCKGSQKYVHEGCLQAWRHQQPLADRNYWDCPTCGFSYRLERLRWGRWISNRTTRALLTVAVFWLAIFLLGFVADPLIDLWLDPGGSLVELAGGGSNYRIFNIDGLFYDEEGKILDNLHELLHQPNSAATGAAAAATAASGNGSVGSWLEHFLKGFFSLGIFGVAKTCLAVSPWSFFNIRRIGVGRARRRAGGQARIEGLGWMFVLVGAFTFLGMVWKGISYLSGQLLERASEKVVDIGGDDDGDDDDSDGEAEETRHNAPADNNHGPHLPTRDSDLGGQHQGVQAG